jgi:predicted RecA/RadA family phage recombinase
MAPPTILYNNANAKYTNYEQPDKNKILETEVALAKSMLTMNIETFNTNAPSGNMNINYSLVTPGTSNTQPLTHVMINQQMNDLGSVFAFVAEHDFDETNGITNESAHLSFDTTSGNGGNGLTTVFSGIVSATDDSASYYESTVSFTTVNTEHTFQDNEDNINKRYTVTYDPSGNFNAEKAVPSRYSSFITDSSNIIATPDTTKNDALQIFENTVFNESHSFYTEKKVLRDTSTNILSVDPSNITYGMSSLTNTSGQYYYSQYIGVPDDIVDPSNERAFFGALRFTQTSTDVIDISGSAAGSNSTTLCMVPSDPGSALPTSMIKSDFDDLFTSAELPYVAEDYDLDIREYLYDTTGDGVDGGYYTNGTVGSGPFRGFDTDDTSVKRNTTYMRKCAEEGQNFSQSVQTVEIANGDLIATRTFTGPNADLLVNHVDYEINKRDVNGNPRPHDTDETLTLTEYQNDYWVKTYFTEPSTSVSATYHRAEEAEGNSSTYTDFRVVYDSSEGVLSESTIGFRRGIYYDNFDITTIFPATYDEGAAFSGSEFIGVNSGFAAVFQSGNSGINDNSDYTFTSSATAASQVLYNEIAIIQIVNTQYMAQEDSLYADGASEPVQYTTATVIGTNINYNALSNTPSNMTDLRLVLTTKTGLTSSTFTNEWSSSLSTGSVLQTDLDYPGIFGSSISSIMTDVSTVAGNTNTIPITFDILTNGTSDNRDSLDLSIGYSWSYGTYSGSGIIFESDISLTNSVPAPDTTTLVLGSDFAINSENASVQNLLSNYNLVRNVETYTTTPSFLFALGSYNNLRITGKQIVIRTVYHTLVHKTTGTKLSDSYLKNIDLTGTYLSSLQTLGYGQFKASRQIIGVGRTSTMNLSISDLYAFKSVIQKKDSSTWTDVSPSYDFDGAHNSFTTFTLSNNAGTITGSIDITVNSQQNVVLDQSKYYIELSTGPDTTSYSVVAKKWNINTLADAQAITTWASTNDVTSSTMPNAGTSIQMTVNVTSSPVESQPSTQPDVTITVTDTNGVIWAKFVTNGVIASSSFNVLYSGGPFFHIVETYKEVNRVFDASGAYLIQDPSNTVLHTYKRANTLTQLQVVDGIELTFDYDTAINDSASYRLLGDYVEASLYNGYAGPYSTLSEVTFENGLVIVDSIARGIDIQFYRGKSVRTPTSDLSWTSRTSAADNIWSSVTFGNGLFVAVSYNGSGNRVMTSPDGITWTSRSSAADNTWSSVTYGNGLFVAVSTSGTGDRVMTSPDGINWTSRTSAADTPWSSVTYGNGLFVAVSGADSWDVVDGYRIMTSPDGITWTLRSSAADNNWSSVTFGNGLFVAVSYNGSGNRVMTSPDGINWTSRSSASDNNWSSVTYGNGLFVAVSTSGTGNRVMTSPDGITWTSRTSAADITWKSVTYGNNLFVAVSSYGSRETMASQDGINWTLSTPANGNNWFSVTYGNGLFVAVSADGSLNSRVMTGSIMFGTYEEFRWNRSVTQINMKIVNTNASSVTVTYTDTPSDLYDGSTHTVTNLSGGIGDLGLKFYGNRSRFRNVNSTYYQNEDIVMNQPITIRFDSYIWSITNPNNNTGSGEVNALQNSGGIVSTRQYSIVNYTGSNPMNIVAGRVWIRHPNGNSGVEESFNIHHDFLSLKVDYLSEQYVGDPYTFDWTDASRIDEIYFYELDDGRFVKTPSSTSSVVIDSFVYIKTDSLSIQDHVGYSLLPRPQIIVETIATKDVSTIPFNYDVPTRTFRGIDIDYETNSFYPFAGKFGTHNGTIGGYRVVNNMEVVFNNDEFYYDLRFDADVVTDKRRKIYIPSNEIKLELYKGHGHTTLVEGLKIGIIYEGYIHKLKNYDVDAFSNANIYQDLCGNVIDSNTYNNYDGTYIDGQQNSDLTYDLRFSQDGTIISPLITSSDIYGQLGGKVVNIELQGISAFMDLSGVAVIDRHLDLLPGDSIKLNLYGHTFKKDASNNLVVEFVKYSTSTGYDFSTIAGEVFIKNLGFNASTRETATVILKTPSTTLTAIPYNFVNVCNTVAADTSFNSLTWVTDTEWDDRSIQDKQLAFNMVCLSTIGQAKLTSILGVSARSSLRMLVSEYPHRLDLRSGDGSPIYGVDSFGKLMNITTSTQVVSLSPQTVSSSDNDVQEYGAYNVLLGNTI